jgi:hypothetical protein
MDSKPSESQEVVTVKEVVNEVVIDPRWHVGHIQIDKATHILIDVTHPRHGKLAFLVPQQEAEKLYSLLGLAVAIGRPASTSH